jgi:O-antigen ligase
MRAVSPPAEPGLPASLALSVLVAIAVLAPWAFGAVLPGALFSVTALALVTAALALAVAAWRGGVLLPAVPLWPLGGFLGLALLQLVPLPAAAHALLAPGTNAVWHPGDAAAAAVLGSGPRPVSLDPDTTLRGIALTGGLVLLALLAAPALSRARAAAGAAGVVAAAGFLVSAYAIFARARFGVLLYGRIPVPTVSPFGPFVSKNHFAGWAAMAALLVAGLALGLAERPRGRGRDWARGPRAAGAILALVAALAMALAVLASLSRGGAIALASGAACLFGLRSRRARPRGLTLSLALALGLALVALVPPEARERLRSLGGSSFRLETWRDSLRLAASSPVLGHGLGAFHDAYPRFKSSQGDVRVEHAENDYVETLAETGLPGLGCALAGLVLLLGAAGRGITSSAERTGRGTGAGAVAALTALAVHSAVDFNLRIPSNAALAALAAAVAAGAAAGRPRTLPRAAAAGLAAACVAVLLAAAALPDRPWLAARREALAAASAASSDVRRLRLERAEIALGKLLGRRPAHAESWLLLAGTRAARGDAAGGASLARHAVWLDPVRLGLREAADRLTGPEPPGGTAP